MTGGSVSFEDLVMPDTTNNTLRLVLDANGVTPVNLSDDLTIEDNARLEVDISAYSWDNSWDIDLVTYAGTRTGEFDLGDITITGKNGGTVDHADAQHRNAPAKAEDDAIGDSGVLRSPRSR